AIRVSSTVVLHGVMLLPSTSLALPDALPISLGFRSLCDVLVRHHGANLGRALAERELGLRQRAGQPLRHTQLRQPGARLRGFGRDRKSTRLNSSHVSISYAVFCLKKKTLRTR